MLRPPLFFQPVLIYKCKMLRLQQINIHERADMMETDIIVESKATRRMRFVKLFLVAVAFVLILTVARPFLTDQRTYEAQTQYLDAKLKNANMITLGCGSASFVVSMLPEDAGTAISNELAKFTGYLLLVISAIFLEKYLLVTIGWVSTAIALLSCVFMIISILAVSGNKTKWKEYALRTLIFSICIACVIPLGCYCGQAIEDANRESINRALENAGNANEIVDSMPLEDDKNFFQKVGDFFAGLWDSAKQAYEWAKSVLNSFMAAIAVMMVTTIAIPVLIFFAFIWAIKFLTKRDFVVAVVGFADSFAEKTRKRLIRKNPAEPAKKLP